MTLSFEMPGMDMTGMAATAQNAAVQQQTQQVAPMGGLSQQTQGLINQNINPITGAAIRPGFFGQGGAAQIGLGAISTLGSLWNSFQQQKIAKKSLALQERTFETNLANQTKTYNTELEDRIRTRYDSERRNPAEANQYIENNRL